MKNTKLQLLIILLIGISLRLVWAKELFLYSHDQDLLGWVIRDILGGHIRLIGQETSQPGVLIGSAFYYFLIPFYLLFGMDPIAGVYAMALISLLTILVIFYSFKNIFDEKTALIASLLYATSFSQVLTDREVVPTTPVMLWSFLFIYAIHLISKSKFKTGFALSAILISLIWHINLGLLLVTPLIPIAVLFSNFKKVNIKNILPSVIIMFIGLMPLFLFEVRHNFQQLAAILESASASSSISFAMKLDRTMQLVSKNAQRFLWSNIIDLHKYWDFYIYAIALAALALKNKISKFFALVSVYWIGIFVVFFSLNSINLSEYYLNSANAILLIIASLTLSSLHTHSKDKKIITSIILSVVALNINSFINQDINKSGYIQRKELVQFIKKDAQANNYPCVAVSYITKPGFNLGYRYLFWYEDLHVNQPDSQAPVYTIVFPHNMVDRIDKSFGALGLIYPNYDKYNIDSLKEICSGENANITDPFFGYTE